MHVCVLWRQVKLSPLEVLTALSSLEILKAC